MLNQTRGQIGLTAYKYLSEKGIKWLGSVLRGENWETIYAQDSQKAMDHMKRHLGYTIQPGDFFDDWKKSIDEDHFNIGMMSETFEHFNQ